MDVFDLKGVLSLDSSKFESGLKSAGSMASSFGSGLMNGMKKIAGFTTAALGVASAATTKFVKDSVQTGMAFDSMMGQVGATMGKDIEQMEQEMGSVDVAFGDTVKHFEGSLREFALFMGQNTKFSATEAAQALNYMALAGYKTEESMQMLPAVLNMAAAGAMDLGLASDMITDTQSALGLSFERTNQMVDEFAKAASSGNTTVEMLGEAFLKVGGLAKELNGGIVIGEDGLATEIDGIQELEIAFTAMANAGIKGNEAGTHMRNMLLKLSSPTDKGAQAFEDLGVSVFDAEGNMRSLADIFSDLNTGLSKVTQAEKLQAIGNIFNARDTASAEALLGAIEGTVEYEDQVYAISTAYEKWGDAIYDVDKGFKVTQASWDYLGQQILESEGAAAAMSSRQLNNLKGSITLFKSALETAKITVSDKLTPALREFIDFGTEGLQKMVDGFNENGLTGAMDAFGDILSDGLVKVIDKLPNLADVAGKLLTTLGKGLLDNIDAVSDAATSIFTMIAELVVKGLPGFLKIGGEILKKIGEWVVDNADMVLDGIGNALEQIVVFIADNAGSFVDGVGKLIGKIANKLPQLIRTITRALPRAIRDIADAIVKNAPELIKGATDSVGEIVKALPDIIKALVDAAPDIITAVIGGILTNVPTLIQGCIDVVGKIVENIPEIILGLINKIPDIIEMFFGEDGFLSVKNIARIVVKCMDLVHKIVISIPTIIGELIGTGIPNIINSILGAFGVDVTSPNSLGYKLKAVFSNVVTISGNVLKELATVAQTVFDDIVLIFKDPKGALEKALDDMIAGFRKVMDSLQTIVTGGWELFRNWYESIGNQEKAKQMQEYLEAYGRAHNKKLIEKNGTSYWEDYNWEYADKALQDREFAQSGGGHVSGGHSFGTTLDDIVEFAYTAQDMIQNPDKYNRANVSADMDKTNSKNMEKYLLTDEEIEANAIAKAKGENVYEQGPAFKHQASKETTNNVTNNTTVNLEVNTDNVATQTKAFWNDIASKVASEVQNQQRMGKD